MNKNSLYNSFKNWAILLLFLILSKVSYAQNYQINLIINPKPTVNFGIKSDSQTPLMYEFSDSSTVASGTIAKWIWSFGDGSTSILQNPTHSYNLFGEYDVLLTVKSDAGCQSSLQKTILMGSSKSIGITVNNPIQCSSDNSFSYAGTGIASEYLYDWDFGDGTTSTERSPVHVYAQSGTFHVRLITSEPSPGIIKDTAYLTVNVIPTPSVQGLNQVYCHAEEVPAYHFSGTVENTVYKWYRIIGQDVGIGLTKTSGIDSIPAFTAQNTGNTYLAPEYRVTPYYTSNGLTCAGLSEDFLITVNPIPTMAEVINQVYYAGELVNAYTFTGNTSDAYYAWNYLSGDSIQGLPKTGINQMPTFSAQNNGSSTLKAQYKAIPVFSYANKTCMGVADTFAISIISKALITFQNRVQICNTETQASLSCINNNPESPIYQKIVFSDKALEAGFTSMNNFSLLTEDSITIAVPKDIKSGQYVGHLHIQDNYSINSIVYDFAIDVLETTSIVQQPDKEFILCSEVGLVCMQVVAKGSNLTYQWYKDGNAIVGANNSTYIKTEANSSNLGTYTVEIRGDCGNLLSQSCNVIQNQVVVQQKWDDVLFVSGRDTAGNSIGIKSFQWYRVFASDGSYPILEEEQLQCYSEDGLKGIMGDLMPIVDKGQSQYYSEVGLQGTFAVEVTFSDGTKQMSCPYTVTNTSKRTITVYPNPGKLNEKINVSLDLSDTKVEGTLIEIFDELGRRIEKRSATQSITEFYLNVAVGTYLFQITEPNGKITTKKVILK